ncbi:hypothetical protein [Halobacteriovorax sp.]|uniref:hypothetical protein n=1 Tax=Halobacteriovorax sp. TaxID=2020862 RepID=UPI003563A543
MKAILLVVLSIISINSNAYFTSRANCFLISGSKAQCEACNYASYRPIQCTLNIQGRTSYGNSFNGVQSGVILPGQCMRGFVFANNPFRDPLVSAFGNVTCR